MPSWLSGLLSLLWTGGGGLSGCLGQGLFVMAAPLGVEDIIFSYVSLMIPQVILSLHLIFEVSCLSPTGLALWWSRLVESSSVALTSSLLVVPGRAEDCSGPGSSAQLELFCKRKEAYIGHLPSSSSPALQVLAYTCCDTSDFGEELRNGGLMIRFRNRNLECSEQMPTKVPTSD